MKTREDLINLGNQILDATRTTLLLDMRFMAPALGALGFKMDLSTRTIGTDAVYIRFNPSYIFQLYIEQPLAMNRTYLHIVMHCLFRHMFSSAEHRHKDARLWDLSADIAVESVIDSMDYPCTRRITVDFREEWYEKLKAECNVLTAERIYQYLSTIKPDPDLEAHLEREFWNDDHQFWDRMKDDDKDEKDKDKDQSQQALPPETAAALLPNLRVRRAKKEEWEKAAGRIHEELELRKRASAEHGSLDRMLSFELRKRASWKDYLKRFAVVREETQVDPDSFDYGLYNFGMEHYGNMPIIEENEFRETRKVEELAIVIDTSASCQDALVQEFLNETATILASQETFFHKVNVHVIECDEHVQSDILITNVADMKKYADGFHIKGGYGTDYRPVFAYIEERQGLAGEGSNSGGATVVTRTLAGKPVYSDYRQLRGLLYFTDGFGIYPTRPTRYDTAFVFRRDEDFDDSKVPDWAVKLFIEDL